MRPRHDQPTVDRGPDPSERPLPNRRCGTSYAGRRGRALARGARPKRPPSEPKSRSESKELHRRREGPVEEAGAKACRNLASRAGCLRWMFFFRYLRSELTRRRTRSIRSRRLCRRRWARRSRWRALARGLDDAQKMRSTHSRHRHRPHRHARRLSRQQQRVRRRPRRGRRRRIAVQAKSSSPTLVTDLSKLGKPGNPLRPRLLPSRDAAHVPAEPDEPVTSLPGVAAVTTGPVLSAAPGRRRCRRSSPR